MGGVTLPLALADLGLIDEYEFLVQPVLAGHGPTLLAGLRERIQLELVDRHEFRSGRSPCDTGRRELRLDVICPGRWPLPRDGAGLAAQAIDLRLVDELRLFRYPVVVGGDTPFLPPVSRSRPAGA